MRLARPMRTRSEYASCVDTVGEITLLPNTPYILQNMSLTNSARATSIGQSYQFYRISKVEVKWKAMFDTFATTGNSSVPNLYYMIDKANTFSGTSTLDTLKQAGAKPVRLDDKTITRSFKPAVHLGSDDSAGGPAPVSELQAVLKVSPWITTNANAGEPAAAWAPNSVDHRGLIFFIEQLVAVPNFTLATVEIVLHFEFKKPLWVPAAGQTQTAYTIDLDKKTAIPPPVVEPPVEVVKVE